VWSTHGGLKSRYFPVAISSLRIVVRWPAFKAWTRPGDDTPHTKGSTVTSGTVVVVGGTVVVVGITVVVVVDGEDAVAPVAGCVQKIMCSISPPFAADTTVLAASGVVAGESERQTVFWRPDLTITA
jgi:hypothetical protein